MGYDLHITRTEASPITETEWRTYVSRDADLDLIGVAETPTPDSVVRYENPGLALWQRHPGREKVWFDFRNGRIVVKNPDDSTIAKMIAVARALKAHVEGDDGEIYETPGAPPRLAQQSFGTRVGSWFARLRPAPKIEAPALPFGDGQRVRDYRGNVGTVVAIDMKANHGAGSIRVRFDDGRELSFMAIGHGLELDRGNHG